MADKTHPPLTVLMGSSLAELQRVTAAMKKQLEECGRRFPQRKRRKKPRRRPTALDEHNASTLGLILGSPWMESPNYSGADPSGRGPRRG